MPRFGPNLFKGMIHFIAKTFQEKYIWCAHEGQNLKMLMCVNTVYNSAFIYKVRANIYRQNHHIRRNPAMEMSLLSLFDGKYVESI